MKRFILCLLLLAACMPTGRLAEAPLLTDDGVRIAYTFAEGPKDVGVILLHMLNRNKEDYAQFSSQLAQAGFPVVAIDFRGHGQSDGNWQQFGDRDFNNMVLDVKAAREFLASKGVEQFVVVGASIGANVALKYAVADPSVKNVILLSPGLDYRGVKNEEAARKTTVPVLIVASREDDYSYLSSQKIESLITSQKKLVLYENAGHGTHMFAKEPLEEQILEWLSLVSS